MSRDTEETLILKNYDESHRAAMEEYFTEFAENGENIREDVCGGFSYTWLYFRESDMRLLGTINIREKDSAGIGNIGYAIRPSERRKGYGTSLLEAGLELCGMLGMDEVTACAKSENEAGKALLYACGFECAGEDGGVCTFRLGLKK